MVNLHASSFLVLVLFATQVLCGVSSAHGAEKVALQLKWQHGFQFAGYYVAKERGYYREAGLDVEIREAGPGVDAVEEVVAGRAEFGVGSSSLLLAHKAGKPVVALAVIQQHSPYVMITGTHSATDSIQDLLGKRVMLDPMADELLVYLKREGVPIDAIQRQPYSFQITDLTTGKTDAISAQVTEQPFYLEQIRFPHHIYTPRAAGIDFYGDNLFASARLLQTQPNQIRAFRDASLRGWEYALAHPTETIDLILGKYAQRQTRGQVQYEAERTEALIHADLVAIGYMNAGRWRHIADSYAEIGLLPPNYALDSFLYDPEKGKTTYNELLHYLVLMLAVTACVGSVAVYTGRGNQRLRRSQTQLAATLEAVPDLLFELDENGIYLDVRSRRDALLAAPKETLLGRCAFDLLPAAAAETLREALHKARQHGADYGRIIQLPLAGSDFWFELSVARKQAPSNEPCRFIVMSRDITDRKRAEDAFRKLSQVVEQNPTPILIADIRGQVEYANPAFCALAALRPEDATEHRVEDFFDIDPQAPCTLGDAWHRLGKGQVWVEECDNWHADGQLLTERITVAPLRNDAGQITHGLCIVENITERRQREKELRDERQRLVNVLSGTGAGTWEWNIQSGDVQFNERWAEMLGYRLDELEPLTIDTWTRRIHPDDLAHSSSMLRRHFAGQIDQYECETRIRTKDGGWAWVLNRGKVISRSPDGRPLMMYGTHMDITARKEAEAKRIESEQLLRSAIDTIGEGFVIYDADDRLTYFNEEYRQLYRGAAPIIEVGRSFEEILRSGVERGVYPDAVGRNEEWLAERLAQHRNGDSEVNQRLEDGRWLKIRERRNASGYTVGFRVDITELVRAKQAAETASLAKSQFLATMSHEIRTPMNGILGMAQILLSPGITDPQRQEYAHIIIKAGQTLLTLLNDMLDLSKIEAGKLLIEPAPLDPAHYLDELKALFEETAWRKGLVMEARWHGAAEPRFWIDPHRLRQMLSNLIGNAVKFTARGEIHIDAHEVKRDGTHSILEFSVSDTGIGIPPDKLEQLFQPFSQADSSTTREYGGSGLGLSIVRSLAELMDGSVGVDSVLGHGSHFWFRIRAERLEAANATETNDIKPATVGTLNGKVLVVDDNGTERKVIAALLGKLGLTASLASNGREAVDTVTQAAPPDLVLMDCQMPDMDGYAATERIRAWESLHDRPPLPIIALTASAFEEDLQHSIQAGMNDFLTKPVPLDTLQTVLAKWLPGNPTVGPAAPPLDNARLLALIAELEPLLAGQKFDALIRFKELQALAAGTDLAAEIGEIGNMLASFRFGPTLERLRALAATTCARHPS
ncbi:PAS domain S-box protein [Zoogloea sp. LCSB751]|uniref:PAS domain S-box protein n=1 Tax=Zoogloea sp. LCSB751 TaxID=1965277 RepID=UPI0009A4EE77|nr:PAS domain S-box protein [Zoogloea sp. LCSB751]